MVAVINNFGGFYNTRVYVNEAKLAGSKIHLPCINKSDYTTTIFGDDVYLGFIHLKSLEGNLAEQIITERTQNGDYLSLENFIKRIHIGIEQIIILIRIDAFLFTKKNKRSLLWDAHMLINKENNIANVQELFDLAKKEYSLPTLEYNVIEDAYDEMELLGFPVTTSYFDLLKTDFRGECLAKDLMRHVGKMVKMVGSFVTTKGVKTKRGDWMAFGTFLDVEGKFFDTTHFPPSLKKYPFTGSGVYLILGKVVEEFGFPSIEVDKLARLPIKGDTRV